MSEVLDEIAAERRRQIEDLGWSAEHDDAHGGGVLARAAAAYALGRAVLTNIAGDHPLRIWPFEDDWWKPRDKRFNLIRAGALIVAEIERFDRLTDGTNSDG